jgi:hypothetical protein
MYVRLGRLQPEESTVVYFKADFTYADPAKVPIAFTGLTFNGFATQVYPQQQPFGKTRIFVVRTHFDETTGILSAEVPEGRLQMQFRRIVVDPSSWRDENRMPTHLSDPSTIQQCLKEPPPQRPRGPLKFIPLHYELAVEAVPYEGQIGPIPFEDPWWKILAAFLAFLFGFSAADAFTESFGPTVARVRRASFSRDDSLDGEVHVDAAVAEIIDRVEFEQAAVDVITGEANNKPIIGADQLIPLGIEVAPVEEPGMSVAKSGIKTGLTYGVISCIACSALFPDPFDPEETVTWHGVIEIRADTSVLEPVSGLPGDFGDSGSVWFETDSGSHNPVALNFGSDPGGGGVVGIVPTASAFPMQRVLDQVNAKLSP